LDRNESVWRLLAKKATPWWNEEVKGAFGAKKVVYKDWPKNKSESSLQTGNPEARNPQPSR